MKVFKKKKKSPPEQYSFEERAWNLTTTWNRFGHTTWETPLASWSSAAPPQSSWRVGRVLGPRKAITVQGPNVQLDQDSQGPWLPGSPPTSQNFLSKLLRLISVSLLAENPQLLFNNAVDVLKCVF